MAVVCGESVLKDEVYYTGLQGVVFLSMDGNGCVEKKCVLWRATK